MQKILVFHAGRNAGADKVLLSYYVLLDKVFLRQHVILPNDGKS